MMVEKLFKNMFIFLWIFCFIGYPVIPLSATAESIPAIQCSVTGSDIANMCYELETPIQEDISANKIIKVRLITEKFVLNRDNNTYYSLQLSNSKDLSYYQTSNNFDGLYSYLVQRIII